MTNLHQQRTENRLQRSRADGFDVQQAILEQPLSSRMIVPQHARQRRIDDEHRHAERKEPVRVDALIAAEREPHDIPRHALDHARPVNEEFRNTISVDDSIRIEQFHDAIPNGCFVCMSAPEHLDIAPCQSRSKLSIRAQVESGDNGGSFGNTRLQSHDTILRHGSLVLEPSAEPNALLSALAASSGHSRIATQTGTDVPSNNAMDILSHAARATSLNRNSITSICAALRVAPSEPRSVGRHLNHPANRSDVGRYAIEDRGDESGPRVLAHRRADEMRADGARCREPGQSDQDQSKSCAVEHRVSPSVRVVSVRGVRSSCVQMNRQSRSSQVECGEQLFLRVHPNPNSAKLPNFCGRRKPLPSLHLGAVFQSEPRNTGSPERGVHRRASSPRFCASLISETVSEFGSLPIARIEPAAYPLCPVAEPTCQHPRRNVGSRIGGAKNGVGDGAVSCELKAPFATRNLSRGGVEGNAAATDSGRLITVHRAANLGWHPNAVPATSTLARKVRGEGLSLCLSGCPSVGIKSDPREANTQRLLNRDLSTSRGHPQEQGRKPKFLTPAQVARRLRTIKAFERGEKIDIRFAEKIEAARGKDSIKIGIVMDDKVITIDMPWATIRSTSEVGLSEYIIKQMRGARDAVN